jgi:acyl carrier protein
VRRILSTSTVPVGRPLDNVRVYLLDEFLQPVPVGVPGEIYIGGPGVARGYLNRPEITAERFIPDPFALKAGARMYRTGDLARWLPDGNIEYLGRVDFQVKIRGFRVELGEIDNLLLRHPSVENAVTLALTDSPGGPRLVSYVLPRPEQNLTSGELRAFVEKDLPDYMVPSFFVIMDAFPLSPNGKVDRKRLPIPSANRPELATDYVPPRNEVERKIAAIWQEVLGIDNVGVHDNFFELGGHSLLLAKVNDQLESTFEQSFNMVDMFRYPTIADLAQHLSHEIQQTSLTDEARRRAEKQRKQRRRRQRPSARGGKANT